VDLEIDRREEGTKVIKKRQRKETGKARKLSEKRRETGM